MKKFFVLIAAFLIVAGQISANPVDVNTAKNLGVKYLTANVVSAKGITDVQHVYTLSSETGVPYLYVFNYENGFVVMSADDRAHPVLGYDEGCAFDENNIPDGLEYYLGHYGRQIQYAIDNDLVAEDAIAEQWELLREEGNVVKTRMDRAVNPLLTTTWDQGWPYNYYAPSCTSYYIGNHCYAGCVACAMSQVMKFWNWPETGVGSHTYSTSSYGGTLSADFGSTTYDWSIMPNQLGSSANAAAQAVALLMYHCGVSVDMNFTPNGSGANTGDVPDAVKQHFRYASCTVMRYRDLYTREAWEDMIIECLDRGIPTVYAGSGSDGGHAFNCDGYNNQRYFHFNWGWSGSYNTYFQIDALNTGNGSFNENQRVVVNMIPDYIYSAMVPAIETLEANVADDVTKTVTLSWTVPSVSATGSALTEVQKITIKRDGTVLNTYNNMTPGTTMTFEDTVDDYGAYQYTIVGANYGMDGEAFTQVVVFGPSCHWKLITQTSNFQGWNGGRLKIVGGNGTVIKEVALTTAAQTGEKIRLPEGSFEMQWDAPTEPVSALTITLKNSAGETAYTYTGSSSALPASLYQGNNDCPNCTPPTDFAGEFAYQGNAYGALLSWQCGYAPSKFKVYRSEDGDNYTEVASVNGGLSGYFDEVANGTYYYKVTAYSSACESNPAHTTEDVGYVVVMVNAVAENSINAKLYPNPTTGNLKIEAASIKTVSVFNLVGQKVYEDNINANECVINMKDYGMGVYMVKIQTESGVTTQKVSVIE